MQMTDAPLWLGSAGLAIMTILMSRDFKGSIICGILFVTIIAWIPGHAASYLGKTSNLPGELSVYSVSMCPSLLDFAMDLSNNHALTCLP